MSHLPHFVFSPFLFLFEQSPFYCEESVRLGPHFPKHFQQPLLKHASTVERPLVPAVLVRLCKVPLWTLWQKLLLDAARPDSLAPSLLPRAPGVILLLLLLPRIVCALPPPPFPSLPLRFARLSLRRAGGEKIASFRFETRHLSRLHTFGRLPLLFFSSFSLSFVRLLLLLPSSCVPARESSPCLFVSAALS